MKNGSDAIESQGNTRHIPALIERLAEKLGGSASARTVYGTPVTQNGVTVIPVATVAYGLGGGGGEGVQGNGQGGGGGVGAVPVGYIEIKDGGASFRRIYDPLALVPLVLAGGIAGAMILRGIYRVIRGNEGRGITRSDCIVAMRGEDIRRRAERTMRDRLCRSPYDITSFHDSLHYSGEPVLGIGAEMHDSFTITLGTSRSISPMLTDVMVTLSGYRQVCTVSRLVDIRPGALIADVRLRRTQRICNQIDVEMNNGPVVLTGGVIPVAEKRLVIDMAGGASCAWSGGSSRRW